MQHILICPFGWLGKNIMPLPGPDGEAGKKTEQEHGRFGGRGEGLREVGIERGKDDGSEGWSEKRDDARLFLTFPSLSLYDGLPSKRPAGIECC